MMFTSGSRLGLRGGGAQPTVYVIKPFDLHFTNYLEDEHLSLFSFPTSSVSK